jgi:shikimate kinase
VIIGAMGSGKTNLGRRLAAGLGREFYDSDQTIESRTGRKGREIAETEGVAALHRMERAALTEGMAKSEPAVIAAAASIVDDAGARAALDGAFCIWVRADTRVLEERASRGSHRRTVATTEHLERRDPLFADLADMVVDTGIASPDDTAARVLDEITDEE